MRTLEQIYYDSDKEDELNENTENLTKLQKDISEIKGKSLYNYTYQYYTGDELSMDVDINTCTHLGNERSGYEEFKQTFSGQIGYSGITSLRTLTQDNDVVGYITETKISTTPYVDAAQKLYNEALEETKRVLDVKDVVSFDYYIQENVYQWDYHREVDGYERGVNRLIELVEDYFENDTFAKFFNKVIH